MTPWPADKVERWPIEKLVPYARNARTHSEEQVSQVVASIREWGWTNPILVGEDGGIIAGHCRVLAGKQLGLAEVPVMFATGWSEAQKRAYVLADNQLTLNGGWNPELLRQELGELADLQFDIGLIGFDGEQLDFGSAAGYGGAGSLAEKFGIPPFSILNAREGWWQDRKRAWLALGIESELGRGDTGPTSATSTVMEWAGGFSARHGAAPGGAGQNSVWLKHSQKSASPGGSPRPAADYSKRQRGNGKGEAIG